MKCLSLVVPVYNEQESISVFIKTINIVLNKCGYCFELIFINDGSIDNTQSILLSYALDDSRIKIIELSRNFGKEYALCAGFEYASGDAVIPMDVDLQDPPELIMDFIEYWEKGADIVVGIRSTRKSDSLSKRLSANLFYKIFRSLCGARMIPNAGDYRLLSRPALEALKKLPECVRFTKGLYAWIGFNQKIVMYERRPREKGSTKWKSWKLWNFAIDGITSFTTLPLRIWSYLGFGIACIGFGYAIILIVRTLVLGIDVPGYASIMVTLLTIGGLILTSLGIIGEYLGRIFEEVKKRPHYIVKSKTNIKDASI